MEDSHSHPRTIHLPHFHSICRWPASCNVHHEQVSAASRQWVSSYNILSPCEWAIFTKCLPELLASWAYPRATPDQLRICCDLISLLFIVDDVSDDQTGEGAASTGSTLLDALRDETFDNGTALCKMTQDFRSRLLLIASRETYRRFLRNMEYYVRSFTLEADLREKNVVLGMNSYNIIRRGNSGCLPAFDLFGIEMPDEVFDNSIFRTMYEDASDLVTIANDVYSYNKEQSTGHDAINILTVLEREQGITLQQAADCAAERFKFLVERFETNMQRLPSFDGEVNAAVRYVMALKSWVAGNMEWSFESYRYFGERGQIVKQALVVELSPFRRPDTYAS